MKQDDRPIVGVDDWLRTAPGRYLMQWETAQFDALVADVFGFNAMQIGLPDWDLLRANRMPFKACMAPAPRSLQAATAWPSYVQGQSDALPFAAQSLDLLVLPHVFECADPHHVLREVDRVLVPEGRVVISGFNPWSLWGLRHRVPGLAPWLPQPPAWQVSLPRLKDWLKLLSFDVDRGRFGCYAPPCRTESWLRRWHFMEAAGDRWWAVGGSVYVVSAVKRVAGVRLIGPAWKKKKAKSGSAVAVSTPTSTPCEIDEAVVVHEPPLR